MLACLALSCASEACIAAIAADIASECTVLPRCMHADDPASGRLNTAKVAAEEDAALFSSIKSEQVGGQGLGAGGRQFFLQYKKKSIQACALLGAICSIGVDLCDAVDGRGTRSIYGTKGWDALISTLRLIPIGCAWLRYIQRHKEKLFAAASEARGECARFMASAKRLAQLVTGNPGVYRSSSSCAVFVHISIAACPIPDMVGQEDPRPIRRKRRRKGERTKSIATSS